MLNFLQDSTESLKAGRDGIRDQFLIFIFIVVPLPVGIGIMVRPVTLSKGLFYSRGHKILGKELVVL